jgi:hypothetical protein
LKSTQRRCSKLASKEAYSKAMMGIQAMITMDADTSSIPLKFSGENRETGLLAVAVTRMNRWHLPGSGHHKRLFRVIVYDHAI